MAGGPETVGAGGAVAPVAAVEADSATGRRRPRLHPPRLARRLVLVALLLHLLAWGWSAPFGSWPVAGALLAAAGLAWIVWAAVLFRRAGTPIRPAAAPRVLVDEGPLRFGRNPMYAGIVVAMLGLGLALGAPLLLPAAMVFAVVVDRVHIPYEEAALQRAFGGWYSDYARRVRRWI
jgi:protein-S-isoprenylcysteine O-methyltransferase Ste14